MQLPGEQTPLDFMPIIPFTPANRNNMVGWLAGRSDGEGYGSLVAYDFPQSRVIDGPPQIEARSRANCSTGLPRSSTLTSGTPPKAGRARRGGVSKPSSARSMS